MEKLVGAYRSAAKSSVARSVSGQSGDATAPSCTWHQDDEGMFEFRIRLAPEDGAVLTRTIEMIAEGLNDQER
jgi:hypothetical protein